MTQARDLMTKDVVVVSPDTPIHDVARLLLARAISAVPVVDGSGIPIGIVSEGDLIGRAGADRDMRRDWWLALLAEGETLSADFLSSLHKPVQTARDVMSAPLVTVDEAADVREIARLLTTYRIKRVPVVRDGRIVGIVSRADILRTVADQERAPRSEPSSRPERFLGNALADIDERFLGLSRGQQGGATHENPAPISDGPISAAALRALAADFEFQKTALQDDAHRALVEQRRQTVKALIAQHVADQKWQGLLHRAREAAEHGATEVMLMQFPSDLCSDGGRAINALEAGWPATLRGEAAELYLRWQHELRPGGFHLTARVLNFPGGMPGDVGLFLSWAT
jgi:CBS domain-containing protein